MDRISLLKNQIRNYQWGSKTAIAELLHLAVPSDQPQAEVWIGTHPIAPSQIYFEEKWTGLDEVIRLYPQDILGKVCHERFKGHLPFLFKILAVETPLSIQAHPNTAQAREGFEREEKLKIPLNAPQRCYKDRFHKPEMICALTPFQALVGFRKFSQIIQLFNKVRTPFIAPILDLFEKNQTEEGLRIFFETLWSLQTEERKNIIQGTLAIAKKYSGSDPIYEWVTRLGKIYPDDIGVLAPLFLNLITLQPKEAVELASGILHCYLEGLAVEIMANSDNVLRCGLTHKHINAPELLRITHFTESYPEVLTPQKSESGEKKYLSRAEEFSLAEITLQEDTAHFFSTHNTVEIILCLQGEINVTNKQSGEIISLKRGRALLIPGAVGHYSLKGNGFLYKASLPK
ncbi:MAG: mannose-6-phosphate isomerase, class I [Candidatus Omnitrophica bacterium]|nr:mannose-6-phosphate isomerase, class I [Candidatus Omnitrophota bacterium]